ncbi:MAG: DNA gyrase modulator, partial [Caldilineaceae bacterium]
MLPVESVRRVLDAALINGGDLAELYLENAEQLSLSLDEGRLEQATQGNDIGGGVRVFYGDTAAYAYTDDLSEEALMDAARAAAAAARSTNAPRIVVDLEKRAPTSHSPIRRAYDEMSTADKAAVLRRMDAAARGYSPHIVSVQASYTQTSRRVWIYNSDGVWAEDDREILEFATTVAARRGETSQSIRTG